MSLDFTSIHNHQERLVYEAVAAAAPGYPAMAGNTDALADVACVALNRLPPRYIRNAVDFSFYLAAAERADIERTVRAAVAHAFEFVQARRVMGARA